MPDKKQPATVPQQSPQVRRPAPAGATTTAPLAQDSLAGVAQRLAAGEQVQLSPHDVLALQRLGGNQLVQRLLADAPARHTPGCGCNQCQSALPAPTIQRHHDEERLQTSPAGATTPASPIRHHLPIPDAIQRHVAFEHYLLGQVAPGKLSNIALVRQAGELEAEINRLIKEKKLLEDPERTRDLVRQLSQAKIKRDEVKHTIEQEMDRLALWKDDPDAVKASDVEPGRVKKNIDDTWQVPYVVLPVRDGQQVVATYSEMNTLPDLFGNPETIANTPKDKVQALLQGVRQQAYIELDNIYKELFGVSRSLLRRALLPDLDFAGATGPRAQAVNEWAYEKRTEMQVNTATSRQGEETQQYFAALERNACHFAPESWSQWEGYHRQARKLAQAAADARAAAADIRERGGNESTALAYEKQAGELGNQALLQNGFGEHYLQDSFAAGHLIDKTKIMQWFVQWLNANDDGLGFTESAQSEWAMVSMVAGEGLSSNPQRLDDKMMRGEITTFYQANIETGMTLQPEIVFMMWWRTAAKAVPKLRELTPAKAAQLCPLDEVKNKPLVAQLLMQRLTERRFASHTPASEGVFGLGAHPEYFELAEAQINVQQGESGAYQSRLSTESAISGEGHDFRKEAAEFNMAAYDAFLHNAYVQAATKFFHDKYCKEGLWVHTRDHGPLFRIYGDNNMLKGGAQEGVAYSAETSKMSREAVFNIIEGTPDQAAAIDTIKGRFPTHATEVEGGQAMRLDKWNEDLKARGETGLFKQAKDNGALTVYKAQTGISSKGALNLSLLDQAIEKELPVEKHGGEF